MRPLLKLLNIIDDTLVGVAAICVAVSMMLGVAEIIARGALNAPIRGQIDIVILLMPAIAIFGISQALSHDAHVRMSLLADFLTARSKHLLEAIGMTLGALVSSVLAVGACEFALRALKFSDNTPDLRLPTWPIKFAVSVCLGLLALKFAVFAIAHLRIASTGKMTDLQELLPRRSTETEKLEQIDA